MSANEIEIRPLGMGDEGALERFLVPRTDSSMFLRANLRGGGIVDRDEPQQGTYVGAFARRELVGVAAHWWNSILSVQAPRALGEVVCRAVALSRRPVAGITGPLGQVRAARAALGLEGAPAKLDSSEVLYALSLSRLRPPRALESGAVAVRRAKAGDLELVTRWRHDFCAESLGDPPGPALLAESRPSMVDYVRRRVLFLAEEGSRKVAMAAFNAALPDSVQLGSVWTPRELRSRGFARAVSAGALLIARGEGVSRGILFTAHANAPARKAYEAIGFEAVGELGLLLLDVHPRHTLSSRTT